MSRLVHDFRRSKKVNRLSPHAERFFIRLLLELDDFGNYLRDPVNLRSMLFPVLPDVRIADVGLWLDECIRHGLVSVYEVSGEEYIHVHAFRQKVRWKRRKVPPAPKEVEVEVEDEVEEKRERVARPLPILKILKK